jgi:hypothetical protein
VVRARALTCPSSLGLGTGIECRLQRLSGGGAGPLQWRGASSAARGPFGGAGRKREGRHSHAPFSLPLPPRRGFRGAKAAAEGRKRERKMSRRRGTEAARDGGGAGRKRLGALLSPHSRSKTSRDIRRCATDDSRPLPPLQTGVRVRNLTRRPNK